MWWKSPYGYSKLCDINTHEKKLIHCMAVFTILYGNNYPPHGEFELICIGKFTRRTWVNFTQQYGKNRQRCQQNKFTMLYGNYCYIFIENFPQKFSPCRLITILFSIFLHVRFFLIDYTLFKTPFLFTHFSFLFQILHSIVLLCYHILFCMNKNIFHWN